MKVRSGQVSISGSKLPSDHTKSHPTTPHAAIPQPRPTYAHPPTPTHARTHQQVVPAHCVHLLPRQRARALERGQQRRQTPPELPAAHRRQVRQRRGGQRGGGGVVDAAAAARSCAAGAATWADRRLPRPLLLWLLALG